MPLRAEVGGVDVTDLCQRIVWRPRLNLIDSGVIRVPSGEVLYFTGENDFELSLYRGAVLEFSGPIAYAQPEGGVDAAYTELTAYDHRIIFDKRLCKDDGNLITPGDVILDNVTAPEILGAYIEESIAVDGAMGITLGTVETGGADVTGVPTDYPMSIERMRALLTSTGQLDQRLEPGVGSSVLNLLNDYDNDLSGSVSFEYATGLHNAQVATVTVDMQDVVNALWYLLGPRVTEERWRGSITPTGASAALAARIATSRNNYRYRQEIRIFDDKGDENSIRPLFQEEWENEAWLRAMPRTFVSIRPERGIAPNFTVGDKIHAAAGTVLDGGFDGDVLVYGFDYATDPDGVDEIEEIITSDNQTGAGS